MSCGGTNLFPDGARWPMDMEVLFIDLCYEEVLQGNLLGSSFTPSVWNDIRNNLKTHTNYTFSNKQVREKLTRIKMNWRKYKNLMLTDTGLGWDNERDLPIADDNWWALWEQANPRLKHLRTKPCKRYQKLCTLFEQNTASGSRARSSAQTPPNLDTFGHGSRNEAIDIDNYDVGMDVSMQSPPIPSSSAKNSAKRRKGHQQQAFNRLLDSFETANNSISSKLNESSQTSEKNKQECRDVMNAVRALPDVSTALMVRAVKFFSQPDNRSLFLMLNPVEQRALLDEL